MQRKQKREERIDLHVHTTASDGLLSPSEVVCLALEQQLHAIAITDHDTVAGVAEAIRTAAGTALNVIPGVELNSEGSWGDLHFLGYYIQTDHEALQEHLLAVQTARTERAYAMVKRLAELGMPLEWEHVQTLANGESIGRPHIARALLERGYVHSLQEAFERFIGNGGPAYVPRLRSTPPEAIALIRQAGGVPVLAHPIYSDPSVLSDIPEYVEYGLRGLEVYYPAHSPQDIAQLLCVCQRYKLVATGGTDFHGFEHREGAFLGSLSVPGDCMQQLKKAAGLECE